MVYAALSKIAWRLEIFFFFAGRHYVSQKKDSFFVENLTDNTAESQEFHDLI